MIVDRPAGDENTGNEEIQPHIGESFQFTNDYKIKDGVKISAGDYFTLKLTDNMDLYGIREDEPTNLDLFADGIGTIAKADYNGQAGTITYTFTKAANNTLSQTSKMLWQLTSTYIRLETQATKKLV